MKPRTTVYVAMNGLVKVADGINYRQERVTLASDPCVAKYPDAWRELGTVDDGGAAYIVMLGDAAVLPRLADRISPIGAVPVPGAEAVAEAGAGGGAEATPDLPGSLTWQKIQTTYRDLAAAPVGWRNRRRRPEEPSRPEVARMLNVSPVTLRRACVKAGKGSTWPPAEV